MGSTTSVAGDRHRRGRRKAVSARTRTLAMLLVVVGALVVAGEARTAPGPGWSGTVTIEERFLDVGSNGDTAVGNIVTVWVLDGQASDVHLNSSGVAVAWDQTLAWTASVRIETTSACEGTKPWQEVIAGRSSGTLSATIQLGLDPQQRGYRLAMSRSTASYPTQISYITPCAGYPPRTGIELACAGFGQQSAGGELTSTSLSGHLVVDDGGEFCSSRYDIGTVDWQLIRGQQDEDHDGVADAADNCKPGLAAPGATRPYGNPPIQVPLAWNPDQADTDQDGTGDACDTLPPCSNTLDDDHDGAADYPADFGCDDRNDPTEAPNPHCSDGLQGFDYDGLADYGADPGCSDPRDDSEFGFNECDDGNDTDGDGLIDVLDPDCHGDPAGTSEGCPIPIAAATGAPTEPYTAEFSGAGSSTRPPSVLTAWQWAFGDGSTGSGIAARHVYDKAGPYTVTLVVTNSCGNTATTTIGIVVDDDLVTITVKMDGPGTVNDCDRQQAICTFRVRRHTAVLLVARPDEPLDGYLGWVGCPTVGPTPDRSCRFVAAVDRSLTVRFDPVVSYAPWANFEPGERHWPADPSTFLAKSKLRWAGHLPPAFGALKCTRSDLVARNVDPAKLSRGDYRYTRCSQSGPLQIGARTFDSNDLTAPNEKGKPILNGPKWGFYLDLPDTKSAWRGVKPPNESSGPYTNAPPMYYELRNRRWIVYWFFSARNFVPFLPGGGGDVHEGDWERIAVRLDANNRATSVAYWAHYCDPKRYSWNDMRRMGALWQPTDANGGEPSHPETYVVRGAHGNYPIRGHDKLACEPRFDKGGGDSHRGGGVVWKTWQRGRAGFRDVRQAAWYGYGGGWGAETDDGFNDMFWGPLGPSKYKNPAPDGW